MIKSLLNKYGIKPSKKLGQNFLFDKSVLGKIIDAAEVSKQDTVLEIGPGLGSLTIELAKKSKKVIAVEKDEKLAGILNNELKTKNIKNVEIIHDDILKAQNLKLETQNYKLVANLPYYIVSPTIRMFLETENKPELMVLMVQKEVAQRICAKPPKMNLLAVSVQFYAEPKIIGYVSKKYFYPQPKVDSAIIRIKPGPIPKIDTVKFFNLVKAGFAHKRKILTSNISEKIQIPPASPSEAGRAKSKCQNLFGEIGINPNARAENLTIDNWLKLYEALKNYL